MHTYKVFSGLPEARIAQMLSDAGVPSMRAVMRRLGLNTASSSASTKLKRFALEHKIDLSRFKTGRRDRNLVGKVFGSLTVLQDVGRTKAKNKVWMCRCVCGKQVKATTAELCSGFCHHCGCKTVYPKGSQSRCWAGYGEISGGFWHQIIRNARIRNLVLEVTGDQVWRLYVAQKGKCALSGVELCLERGRMTASLDRKNSREGYTLKNVQWVHKTVNMMKQMLSDEDFILWARRVVEFNDKKYDQPE